jgi:DNA (cytosine-5)-methyltransferase 1
MVRGQIIDLFSGVGGFSLAGHWNGWKTVIFCEIKKFCQQNLRKNFPDVAIHSNIKTLNRAKIEKAGWDSSLPTVVCGGFPCQPASVAGKRAGQTDSRWLWPEMFRIIAEIKPNWVIAENVPGLLSLSFPVSEVRLVDKKTAEWVEDSVFEDICQSLEEIGYEVQAFVIPAGSVGAIHYRERVWILAHSDSNGQTASSIQRVDGSHDGRSEERTKKTVQTDRDFPAIRTKQLHPDSDTNSKRRKKQDGQPITKKQSFDPGIFSSEWSLDWNPSRSEILRENNGLS